MRFFADLHIHSKHSRATSGHSDIPNLEAWARIKGIGVLGTGDFTHPGWFSDLRENLVDAGGGLFRAKPGVMKEAQIKPPASCGGEVRFVLSSEISCIYKRGGRTRKVHNLILSPDFGQTEKFNAALAKVGNLKSDGRPILGLDSRDLLEIMLENAPGAVLIPAHVWTPWFSLFGSKSGFDAVEECFADLSDRIFALETGLSSDPAMNWRVSALDGYSLVSHSDAHSPQKLGREADIFDCDLSFDAMMGALKTGEGFSGTIEFYPEEGKYHLDGHRKCGVSMWPRQTAAAGGLCPVCGKPVTVGVLNRVEELADREEGARPEGKPSFASLAPLPEILSEVLGCGPNSAKIQRAYFRMIEEIGPELDILTGAGFETVAAASSPAVAEAVRRVRSGDVFLEGGYDGEYGTVRVFRPGERERIGGQGNFFKPEEDAGGQEPNQIGPSEAAEALPRAADPLPLFSADASNSDFLAASTGLNREQLEAVNAGPGALLIVAGPGTGKTYAIAARIARLVASGAAGAASILALTFTNQAASELERRLAGLLPPEDAGQIEVRTFHSLCNRILKADAGRDFRIAGVEESAALLKEAAREAGFKGRKQMSSIESNLDLARREGISPEGTAANPRFGQGLYPVYAVFARKMREAGVLDFDGLVVEALALMQEDDDFLKKLQDRWKWLFVDEYQDINPAQYALLRLLAPEGSNLCAIGDPDQAIYGFRGSDPAYFLSFPRDWPKARVVRFTRNYRSSDTILSAAAQVMAKAAGFGGRVQSGLGGDRIVKAALATDKAEAEFVAHAIEREVGGVSFFSRDSGRVGVAEPSAERSFSDFAVLARTEALLDPVAEALDRLGLPVFRSGAGRLCSRPGVQSVLEALRSENCGDPIGLLAKLRARLDEPASSAAKMLEGLAADFQGNAASFADMVALGSEVDALDPRADRVSCMTMHAAKGLEFGVVFVIGCEDGLIPLKFGSEPADVDEERRLFFVALTRAKSKLFLTRSEMRRRRGKLEKNPESPFLAEVEKALLSGGGLPAGKRRRGPRQLEMF